MALSSEGASALGAHLEEMDKLLRDIQVELLPGREPAPPLVATMSAREPEPAPAPQPSPVATAAVPPPTPDPGLQTLTELSTRLLASIRELLVGYERVLVGSSSPPPPARRAIRRRPDDAEVTLSAGPFPSLDALREFEQAVSSLPGVCEVAIRGYEGTDRAIIEVRLHRESPEPRPGGRNP